MKLFELYIDELGVANPTAPNSDVYVLSGCAIESNTLNLIKVKADQIKFKYWGNTNIVFHSREIGRNEGVFSIFKTDDKLKSDFLSDLFNFLKIIRTPLFTIVVDLHLAKKKGWNSIKIIQESSRKLFYHYLVWLLGLSKSKGKVVIESATAEKDKYYLNQFSYFLSPGCRELSVDYKVVQNLLTSISFVTKHNHDIGEQIADLFAYAAKCKYEKQVKKKILKHGSYEDEIIRILNNKLFQKPKLAKEKKMKFYETIDPFCVLPQT